MGSSASAQRKRDMRKSFIEHLAGHEGEMPGRKKWLDILPQDPPPPGFTKSMFKSTRKGSVLWELFTTEEIDEIQEKAVKRKIARMGDKAAHVLEKLYEHALEGDTRQHVNFSPECWGVLHRRCNNQSRLAKACNLCLPSSLQPMPIRSRQSMSKVMRLSIYPRRRKASQT